MPKGKELIGRIRSVTNTRKITRTMELVATSRLKKAQDRVIAARPYAEALRGAEIAVPRTALPALADGEVYHADLVGLRVREGERAIGEVLEVSALPSVDVLRVRTARGTIEIPMVEPYLVAIDVGAGTVDVAHSDDLDPEG